MNYDYKGLSILVEKIILYTKEETCLTNCRIYQSSGRPKLTIYAIDAAFGNDFVLLKSVQ